MLHGHERVVHAAERCNDRRAQLLLLVERNRRDQCYPFDTRLFGHAFCSWIVSGFAQRAEISKRAYSSVCSSWLVQDKEHFLCLICANDTQRHDVLKRHTGCWHSSICQVADKRATFFARQTEYAIGIRLACEKQLIFAANVESPDLVDREPTDICDTRLRNAALYFPFPSGFWFDRRHPMSSLIHRSCHLYSYVVAHERQHGRNRLVAHKRARCVVRA